MIAEILSTKVWFYTYIGFYFYIGGMLCFEIVTFKNYNKNPIFVQIFHSESFERDWIMNVTIAILIIFEQVVADWIRRQTADSR